MVGFRGSAVGGQAEGGADILDGGMELFEGELTVAIRVELLKLVMDEVGEDVVVLNQLFYIGAVHHFAFRRLHCVHAFSINATSDSRVSPSFLFLILLPSPSPAPAPLFIYLYIYMNEIMRERKREVCLDGSFNSSLAA